MMNFLVENAGTLVVLIGLVLVVAFISYRLIRNHKEGKSNCGCGCSSECQDRKGCGSMHMVKTLQKEMADTKNPKK